VVWDVSRNGYDTFLAALAYAAGGAALHLEDDVELTTGFGAKVEAVLADHGNDVVQFFSRRGDDAEKGSRAQPGAGFTWTVCFYVPERLSRNLASFGRGWSSQGFPEVVDEHGKRPAFDYMVGAFLQAAHESYWLSVPSLVQHKDWTSAVNSRRSRRRQSATFAP
jgi:hypothetical protein